VSLPTYWAVSFWEAALLFSCAAAWASGVNTDSKMAAAAELAGGDRAHNREIAIQILEGAPGPRRDIVLVNTAAALMAAGVAADPAEAMQFAATSIDSGSARTKLQQLAAFTQAS